MKGWWNWYGWGLREVMGTQQVRRYIGDAENDVYSTLRYVITSHLSLKKILIIVIPKIGRKKYSIQWVQHGIY